MIKIKSCQKCNGTGKQIDMIAVGKELRRLRVLAGLNLEHMATRMGISRSYLCDMEQGRRAWSTARIALFKSKLTP